MKKEKNNKYSTSWSNKSKIACTNKFCGCMQVEIFGKYIIYIGTIYNRVPSVTGVEST